MNINTGRTETLHIQKATVFGGRRGSLPAFGNREQFTEVEKAWGQGAEGLGES